MALQPLSPKKIMMKFFDSNLKIKNKPWEEEFFQMGKAEQMYAMQVSARGQSTFMSDSDC